MKRPKRKMSPGVSRARRPKTGNNKGMLILLSEDEKMSIEKAAAKEGRNGGQGRNRHSSVDNQ